MADDPDPHQLVLAHCDHLRPPQWVSDAYGLCTLRRYAIRTRWPSAPAWNARAHLSCPAAVRSSLPPLPALDFNSDKTGHCFHCHEKFIPFIQLGRTSKHHWCRLTAVAAGLEARARTAGLALLTHVLVCSCAVLPAVVCAVSSCVAAVPPSFTSPANSSRRISLFLAYAMNACSPCLRGGSRNRVKIARRLWCA